MASQTPNNHNRIKMNNIVESYAGSSQFSNNHNNITMTCCSSTPQRPTTESSKQTNKPKKSSNKVIKKRTIVTDEIKEMRKLKNNQNSKNRYRGLVEINKAYDVMKPDYERLLIKNNEQLIEIENLKAVTKHSHELIALKERKSQNDELYLKLLKRMIYETDTLDVKCQQNKKRIRDEFESNENKVLSRMMKIDSEMQEKSLFLRIN